MFVCPGLVEETGRFRKLNFKLLKYPVSSINSGHTHLRMYTTIVFNI